MKSNRQSIKFRSADARFLQLAAGLVLLMTLIAIWLGRDHMVLLADMHRLQTETLSRTITHQKMARNLDELRRHGERVLFAGTPEERKQALLVVQLVVNSPAFVSDVKVSAVASATERFLNVSEADRRFGGGVEHINSAIDLIKRDGRFDRINSQFIPFKLL